jgi:hypothetical protein
MDMRIKSKSRTITERRPQRGKSSQFPVNDSADVLIDHVEFLYAEAAKGKRITFFCAPRIVRGLDLMVPKHVENVSEFIGKNVAVRDSGRPYAITLWLRMMGLEGKVGLQSSRMRTWEGGASGRKS